MTRREALAHLTEELRDRMYPIAALDQPDAIIHVESEAARIAQRTIDPLMASDDKIAGDTVDAVMAALWPVSDPDHDWWRTPTGRICARSIGHQTTDAVTHSIAGAILGINPKSIGQMVNRGHLERHPDGGVTLASVLLRLDQRR